MDDPSILALEAWGIISKRLFACLGAQRVIGEPASTVASVPIDQMRLSHVAQCSPDDLLRVRNLGRGCFREIWLVLESYGLTMNGSSARPERWRAMWPGGPEKWIANWEADRTHRCATFDRDLDMLEAHEHDGVPVHVIAQRAGVSGALASLRIRQARRRLASRALHPLVDRGAGCAT